MTHRDDEPDDLRLVPITGDRLAMLRCNRGLSRGELARRAETDEQRLTKIEGKAHARCRGSLRRRLAEILKPPRGEAWLAGEVPFFDESSGPVTWDMLDRTYTVHAQRLPWVDLFLVDLATDVFAALTRDGRQDVFDTTGPLDGAARERLEREWLAPILSLLCWRAYLFGDDQSKPQPISIEEAREFAHHVSRAIELATQPWLQGSKPLRTQTRSVAAETLSTDERELVAPAAQPVMDDIWLWAGLRDAADVLRRYVAAERWLKTLELQDLTAPIQREKPDWRLSLPPFTR